MSLFTFSTAGIMLAVMALTTYAIRVTPMAIFHRKLENRWFKDFMFYIPFCVLAAMTFPDVIYSTKSLTSGIVATVVALIMSWRKRDLLTVAIGAVAAAVLVEYLKMVAF
ncbi:MAG: branched-chain amino acid transporter [Bacteroidetes bacterium]|nr:branched-chain amino acid transporter [Bacteroidota bacterium]